MSLPAPMPLSFTARIEIIGVNPYVVPPEAVLEALFEQAGVSKGKIPVRMTIDGHAFTQTLVRYAGSWRLYLNQPMRTAAGKETGATAEFTVVYNPVVERIAMHPILEEMLKAHKEAKTIFESLAPSLQYEIVRYIGRLKSEDSVRLNTARALRFLMGEERFIGRNPIGRRSGKS